MSAQGLVTPLLVCGVFSGLQLATSSGDTTVKIWDFANASCIQTFADHQKAGEYICRSCCYISLDELIVVDLAAPNGNLIMAVSFFDCCCKKNTFVG